MEDEGDEEGGVYDQLTIMEDPDMMLPTISGNEVILAYGGNPKAYTRHSSDSRVCSCLFWSRYSLFAINFLVWAAGLTIVGLGAWTHIESLGLNLFDSLLRVPSIMLMATGVAMVIVGICGWVGALRLNIRCLRVFMVLVVLVFTLQLASGALVFFMLDNIEDNMLVSLKTAITAYGIENNTESRDEALNYLQERFTCCGASSYSDWEVNDVYNCSSTAPSRCGVPSSCCRRIADNECGYGTRDGTIEFTEMFIHTEGCIIKLMDMFKDNITLVAAITFTVGLLEICSLLLAMLVVRDTIFHRKLISDS